MLLTNVTLLNWAPPDLQTDRAVLIRDGRIAAIGPSADLAAAHPAEEVRDGRGRLLLPGNICAHTHLYGAFARGMAIPGPAPRDFPEVLRRLWWPLDRALTLEDVRLSALVCMVDAIRHGTTTLIDHHASPNAIDGSLETIGAAAEAAGLRAVLCYEVSDRDGDDKAQAGIAENVRFLRQTADHPLVRGTFGLHASLTLSDVTLHACREANEPFGGGFHIHVAEHEADQEDSLRRSGVRVVRRLEHAGILNSRTIAAHCVHIDAWEMDALRAREVWVSHQPRSNMNNGVGAMAFDTMRRGGLKVCLGNDGFGNDMFAEWKAAYLLHKLAQRDPRAADGAAVVSAAVTHNAELVGQFFPGQTFGDLNVGATADMILMDHRPHTPLTADNAPWHAIFGFESSMVCATFVAGRALMWERELLTLDADQIAAQALARAPEVWARYRTQH
jgi:putative selenium metabolism protein SsnA